MAVTARICIYLNFQLSQGEKSQCETLSPPQGRFPSYSGDYSDTLYSLLIDSSISSVYMCVDTRS